MKRLGSALALMIGLSVTASAQTTVTIEKIVRSVGNSGFNRDLALTDPVPGRSGAFVFWSSAAEPPPPVINASGEVVFKGFSASATSINSGGQFGIYAKRPGFPLIVLMDTTADVTGTGTFAVPGRPGNRFFGINGAPLVNNAGDVVFMARYLDTTTFAQGVGIYSTTTSGGPLVKIVDTFDPVAGQTVTTSFENFSFTVNNASTFGASLNDLGQVVYWAQFCDGVCTSLGRRNGIFGTTVSGATHALLADSTRKVCPTGIPFGLTCDPVLNQGFWEIRPEIALNNAGVVAFHGGIRRSNNSNIQGTYAVSVTGATPPLTVALQFQTEPPATPSAPLSTYQARFDDNEINDAGDYLFQPLLSAPCCFQRFGLIGSTVLAGPQSNVVDTLGNNGLIVPGDIPGSQFFSIAMASINESGQMGFYSSILNSATPNNQGIYATDLFGAPITLVMDTASIPPGQSAGAQLTSFPGLSAVINDAGHMAFSGQGVKPLGTGLEALYGLYFYDSCAEQVVRISDSTTALSELGVGFGGVVTGGSIGYRLFQSGAARAGKYTSMNKNGDVAFLAKFSNFGMGLYVAHVNTATAGAVAITCPADITLDCPADTSSLVTGDPIVTGCGTITVASSDTSVAACGGTETITRTWTANGTASCVQIITTTDTIAPTLTVPTDVVISCDASTDPSNTGQATTSDACDAAAALTFTDVVTPDAACAQAKLITRTWTTTDACGNSASGVQLITVQDTTSPTLALPLDVTVECGTSTNPSSTGQASITDNCDAAPTLAFSDAVAPGACAAESVITRTWTGADACGNAVSGVQTITVVDTTAPMLTVAMDATVECGGDTSPTATGTTTATDNCDAAPVVVFADTVTGGVCPQESIITRTWTATDACGNAASAVQTINVVDSTPPVVSLVGAGTVVLAGCVGDAYVEAGATATDNCDTAPIGVAIGGDTVDTSLPATFTITYDATDACGNAAAQVTRIVNVVDSSAPTFTSLPMDLTVECQGVSGVPAGDPAIAGFLGTAAATDACDPIVGITNDAPGAFPFGATTVTWTATDSAGNDFMASRLVTVVDTTAPVAVCPSAITASVDALCQATVQDVTAGVIATDGCDAAASLTVSQSPAAGSVLTVGTHTIAVTVTDASGNTGQCTVGLTVTDDTAPTVTPPPAAIAECDQPSDPSVTGMATAVDNCDAAPVVTFADNTLPSTCPELTTITRTWTATDASGNTASAVQAVSVVDTTAPGLSCPVLVSTSGGFGGVIVTFTPSAIDACDPAPTVSSAPPSGSFFATGVTSVSANAADSCANTSACGFDVLVSCYGVNRAKIGTKESSCRGIEWIELTSSYGTEEIVSLYKAEEGSGGIEEDTLPPTTIVDDGINGPVTIDTSCTTLIQIGDIFGAYTVTDLKKDFDEDDDVKGNEVEVRGSFVPATPFDLALDDVTWSIDDGMGHVASFTIPAGSFQIDGNPNKAKYKFEGIIGGAEVHAKFEKCKFRFEAENAMNTGQLVGATMTSRLDVGANVGEETLVMEQKRNHLKFKRTPKLNCCPKCKGIASMQVTSSAGVLLFEPAAGQTKLASNTTVDDGVNIAVTIHTSCSQSIEVGDVFGPYTVSELVKIFDTQ